MDRCKLIFFGSLLWFIFFWWTKIVTRPWHNCVELSDFLPQWKTWNITKKRGKIKENTWKGINIELVNPQIRGLISILKGMFLISFFKAVHKSVTFFFIREQVVWVVFYLFITLYFLENLGASLLKLNGISAHSICTVRDLFIIIIIYFVAGWKCEVD